MISKGAARVSSAGKVTKLDAKIAPDENITQEDVQKPDLLAKFLIRLFRDVADLKRRFWPRRLEFEDISITIGSDLALAHNFNGRVRWTVIGIRGSAFGLWPLYENTTLTDKNVLHLTANDTAVVSIEVREAG